VNEGIIVTITGVGSPDVAGSTTIFDISADGQPDTLIETVLPSTITHIVTGPIVGSTILDPASPGQPNTLVETILPSTITQVSMADRRHGLSWLSSGLGPTTASSSRTDLVELFSAS
jgi:hypothetical protein